MRAVVVFGAPAWPDGTPRPPLRRRLETAWQVAERHSEAVVVLSGGDRHGPVEAEVMGAWLQSRGLARSRIILEPQARSTIENAAFVALILKERRVEVITLVTEQFHMTRSRILLARALKAEGIGHVGVEPEAAPDLLNGTRRFGWALREWVKLGLARLRS